MGSVLQLIAAAAQTSATPSLAFSSNVAKGNLLVATISNLVTTTTFNSISDTIGTPYTLVQMFQASGKTMWVHAGIAPSSGANTVSWNLSAATAVTPALVEANGFTTTLDVKGTYNGAATTTPSIGPLVTTNAGDLILAFIHGGTISSGASGWTNQFSAGNGASYQIPGVTGSFTATYGSSSLSFLGVMAAFTPPVTPPPTPPPVTLPLPNYLQGNPFVSTLRIALLSIWAKWPYRLIEDVNGNLYTADQLLNNQNVGTKALMQVMVEYCPELGTIVWLFGGTRQSTLYMVTNQTRNPAFMTL